MKTLIGILFTAIVPDGARFSAPPSDPEAEKEVMAAMQTWRTAMMKKDGAALTKLYHEDISYGHSSGIVENKAEAVNHMVTTKVDYAAVDSSTQDQGSGEPRLRQRPGELQAGH